MSTFLKILTKYVTKRPATQATVVKVEQVLQHFRVIELACPTPFKTALVNGDKISITTDGKRHCYTPIAVEGLRRTSGSAFICMAKARLRLGIFSAPLTLPFS